MEQQQQDKPLTLPIDEMHSLLEKHAGQFFVVCENPKQILSSWKYQTQKVPGRTVASLHEQRKSKKKVLFCAQIEGQTYVFHLYLDYHLSKFQTFEARNQYNFVLTEVDLRTVPALQSYETKTPPFDHWTVFTASTFNQSADREKLAATQPKNAG
jgi:hypothetical protein